MLFNGDISWESLHIYFMYLMTEFEKKYFSEGILERLLLHPRIHNLSSETTSTYSLYSLAYLTSFHTGLLL